MGYSDADVSYALRGRTSDDLSGAYTRPVLVCPSGTDSVDRGIRHAGASNINCGLWAFYDPAWLGLGAVRLGLCRGLVSVDWPRETARLSAFAPATVKTKEPSKNDLSMRRWTVNRKWALNTTNSKQNWIYCLLFAHPWDCNLLFTRVSANSAWPRIWRCLRRAAPTHGKNL